MIAAGEGPQLRFPRQQRHWQHDLVLLEACLLKVMLTSKLLHALLLEPGNGFLFSSEAFILLPKTSVDKRIGLA